MDSLAPSKAAFLVVAARVVVPEVAELDEDGRDRFNDIVDRALMDRPEGVRRQLAVFLGIVRWVPVLRFGRVFDRLGHPEQERFLLWLEDCPVSLLRKGFWGLKTLVFMGYYGQAEVWPRLGYVPRTDEQEWSRARA